MKTTTATTLCAAMAACLFFTGCPSASNNAGGGPGSASGSAEVPVFTLAWSEYPSWSVFGVAHEMKLLDKEEGVQGELEKKWGVDIVLKEADYAACLNMFTSKNCDAVCMTNMDALIVSPGRDGVAFLPTSTSVGADACIVVGINNLEELKPHKIYGLEATVSEYCFYRCVQELEEQSPAGHKPEEFQFSNQDPGQAAVAMAQKQESHQAIMVWNPFVLQTLNDRPEAKVLFDSSMIPGEIVDMVVIGADVLGQDGADKFIGAVIDTFYRMNEELAKPDTGDVALKALGDKFSNLDLEDMKKVVQQTQFYKTADEAVALLDGDEIKTTMTTVEKFCVDQGLVDDPRYGFGTDGGVQLLFDSSHIKAWQEGKR